MDINKATIDGNGNILIQGTDNSEIIINIDKPEEIRQFLIDFQYQLKQIPYKIFELMESQNPNDVEIIKGANIYLALNVGISMVEGDIQGSSLGVTITNLTKENRFFQAPIFKLSTEFKGNDTFALMDRTHGIIFPNKLEYGEVVTEDYPLRPGSKFVFEEVYKNDPEATLKVIVNTTVGEIYHSNEYNIKRIIDHFDYSK